MTINSLLDYLREKPKIKILLFANNIGARLLGTSLKTTFTIKESQFESILALHEKIETDFLVSPMDLSVEAECFGSSVIYPEKSAPEIREYLIKTEQDVKRLTFPEVGSQRSGTYLRVIQRLVSTEPSIPILGGVTGPFTLAGRLLGEISSFQMVFDNAKLLHKILNKLLKFIIAYAKAFRDEGATGIILSEPAAGLLSPKDMNTFSSSYIKFIIDEVEDESFRVIYHNCAAKTSHLDSISKTGGSIFHFSETMNISEALEFNNSKQILLGNLDPVKVFCSEDREFVIQQINQLIKKTANSNCFVISPGCELPYETPIGNIGLLNSLVRT